MRRTGSINGRSGKWRTVGKMRLTIRILKYQTIYEKTNVSSAFCVTTVEPSIGDYKRNKTVSTSMKLPIRWKRQTEHIHHKNIPCNYMPFQQIFIVTSIRLLFICYASIIHNLMYYPIDSYNAFLSYVPLWRLLVLCHESYHVSFFFPFWTAFLPSTPSSPTPSIFSLHYHRSSFSSYWISPLMFHIIRVLPQGLAIRTFLKMIKEVIT